MKWTKEVRTANKDTITKEMLSLITDGMCKEFKIYWDNIQFDLAKTTLKQLEETVATWQRFTTTGKTFTSACNPAKLSPSNAMSSALELD